MVCQLDGGGQGVVESARLPELAVAGLEEEVACAELRALREDNNIPFLISHLPHSRQRLCDLHTHVSLHSELRFKLLQLTCAQAIQSDSPAIVWKE